MMKRNGSFIPPTSTHQRARLTVFGLGVAMAGGPAVGQTIRFALPVINSEIPIIDDMVMCDLNRDGLPDMAVVDHDELIHFFLNDGAGGFVYDTTISAGYRYDGHIASGDLDADDDVDLVWAYSDSSIDDHVFIWFNSGDGRTGDLMSMTPTESYGDLIVCDLSGDGLNDVVYYKGEQIFALVNQGDRTFVEELIYQHPDDDIWLDSMAVGDFDNDGDMDIAPSFEYSYWDAIGIDVKETEVHLLINDEFTLPFISRTQVDLSFPDVELAPDTTTAGDFDGDGDLDLVVTGSSVEGSSGEFNRIAFVENVAGSALQVASEYTVSDGEGIRAAAGDANADGLLDFFFSTSITAGIYGLRNEGAFEFTVQNPFPTGVRDYRYYYRRPFALADVTQDGQCELIDTGEGGFAVLENITNITNPTLSFGPLISGQEAFFIVEGAKPAEVVRFTYSLHGTGYSTGQPRLGGIVLDLKEPLVHFGTVTADANGRAVLRARISKEIPLQPVTIQAVIRRGPQGSKSVKTTFQAGEIID